MAFFAQIPAEQTFGSTLGAGLGQGLAQGAQAGLSGFLNNYYQQKKATADAERKQNQLQKFFSSEEGKLLSPEEKAIYSLSSSLPGLEGIGREILKNKRLEKENQEFMKLIGGAGAPPAEAVDQAEISQPQTPSQTGYSREQLELFTASKNPQIREFAKQKLEDLRFQEKQKRTEFTQERDYNTKQNEKFEAKMSGLREANPAMLRSLEFAKNAVKSGQVGAFSKNALADAIGGTIGDALRTAEGAQLITASKESLLSNISRVTSKGQNMWFEQRLNQMFPKIGQSEEANLTAETILETEAKLSDNLLNTYNNLKKKDVEKYGYARSDLEERTYEAAKDNEKRIMDEANYKLKYFQEQQKSDATLSDQIGKKVSRGTPLTPRMANLYYKKYKDPRLVIQAAEKDGYFIPSIEDVKQWSEDVR